MYRTTWLILITIVLAFETCFAADNTVHFDKRSFESYIRYLLLWGPEINVEIGNPTSTEISGIEQVIVRGTVGNAVQIETFFVAHNGHSVIHGGLLDLRRDPFEATRNKLTTANQPSFGSQNAEILVIVFSDFECPFCKMESSVLRSDLVRHYPNQVRVVFRDFPNTRMHPWANQAAVIGRCIFHQNALLFWNYHDWVFEHQGEISSASLLSSAAEALKADGLKKDQLEACLATATPQEEVDRSVKEAVNLGVTGTPILFINGRMMMGSAWPTLQQAIDTEIEHNRGKKTDLSDCGCGFPDSRHPSLGSAIPR